MHGPPIRVTIVRGSSFKDDFLRPVQRRSRAIPHHFIHARAVPISRWDFSIPSSAKKRCSIFSLSAMTASSVAAKSPSSRATNRGLSLRQFTMVASSCSISRLIISRRSPADSSMLGRGPFVQRRFEVLGDFSQEKVVLLFISKDQPDQGSPLMMIRYAFHRRSAGIGGCPARDRTAGQHNIDRVSSCANRPE